jgi:uncharacterized membrane protein/heat shock protein HslJ
MKRIILLFTLGAAICSCNTQKAVLSNDYIQGKTFSGTLPCTDCEGISQVVTLDSNNKFRLSETYLGKDGSRKEQSGSWSLVEGKVVLYSDNNPIAQYAVAGDRLVYLDDTKLSQKKNNKHNSGQAMLAKTTFIRSKKINPDFLEGIDIVGFGADPSWSLDINHNKAIQFSIPGLNAPVAFSPVPPRLSGDSIIYNVVSENDKMQISLTPGVCNDGVSGNIYDYKVTVNYKGKAYNGCGAVMNADGSLTGAWLLDNIEGESKKWETQPYIVVDLAAEKFYGNTGCNNFSGSARMRGPKICFSDIQFESQKECPAYDESLLIEALIKCNGFTIVEGKLQMMQDGKLVMNFNRQLEDYL